LKRSDSIVLIILLLAFLSACSKGKDVVAVVGSQGILAEDFEIASKRKASLLGKESLVREEKVEVLNAMIERELLFQFAKKKGFQIDKVKMEEELRKLSRGDISGSEKRFLKREIEKNLYIDSLRDSIRKEIQISQDDIASYYRKNLRDFTEPETYKVYLLKIKESDARHLLEVFNKDPDSFDKVALENVPPDIKELNRNAPYTPLEGFPDEMAGVLKKAEVKRIYGPVKTKRGVFLFKLVDKRSARTRPLSEVSREIEHLLIEKELEKRLKGLLSELRKTVKIEIKATF
jgi:foldase protein PrsA